MYGDKFEKGMFLTNPSQKGSFYIFEGIDLSENQYHQEYTLIAAYNPRKYCKDNDVPYESYTIKEWFVCASHNSRCSETIYQMSETSWIRQCTKDEKEQAIRVLGKYGYDWSDDLLALIDKTSGEIVRQIPHPSNEYKGDTIIHICQENKSLLQNYVESKNKPFTSL